MNLVARERVALLIKVVAIISRLAIAYTPKYVSATILLLSGAIFTMAKTRICT